MQILPEKEIDEFPAGYDFDAMIAELFGISLNPYSASWDWAILVQAEMHKRGYWMYLRSAFGADNDGWWCGFAPLLTTGWNGRPDHQTTAETGPLAICRSALKTLMSASLLRQTTLNIDG